MKRVQISAKKSRRHGFTLVELLVVIVVVAILAALLLVSFNSAMAKGKQTVCVSNLQRLGTAFAQYAAEHQNFYPYGIAYNVGGYYGGSEVWTGMTCLAQYIYPTAGPAHRGGPIFQCPACPDDPSMSGYGSTYSYNFFLLRVNQESAYPPEHTNVMQIEYPSKVMLLGCGVSGGVPSIFPPGAFGYWHPAETNNFLFADYHIEIRTRSEGCPTLDVGL